jgi:hypothetical protein
MHSRSLLCQWQPDKQNSPSNFRIHAVPGIRRSLYFLFIITTVIMRKTQLFYNQVKIQSITDFNFVTFSKTERVIKQHY